jgi:hypothetical protein
VLDDDAVLAGVQGLHHVDPARVVSPFTVTPVSSLVTVTRAVGMRAPVGAVTVPERVARPVCAERWGARERKAKSVQTASGKGWRRVASGKWLVVGEVSHCDTASL